MYVLGSEYLLCIKLANTHKSGSKISKRQTNISCDYEYSSHFYGTFIVLFSVILQVHSLNSL